MCRFYAFLHLPLSVQLFSLYHQKQKKEHSYGTTNIIHANAFYPLIHEEWQRSHMAA